MKRRRRKICVFWLKGLYNDETNIFDLDFDIPRIANLDMKGRFWFQTTRVRILSSATFIEQFHARRKEKATIFLKIDEEYLNV